MTEVVVVDSGGANIASLRCAFGRLGVRTRVSADGSTIASAERIVLPGVGAAAHAMQRLQAAGLIQVLRTLTQPVLGICLGMQLLLERSEEGPTRCLGVLLSRARSIEACAGHPVPHMGWNRLRHLKTDPLLEDIKEGSHVYFVHSYATGVTEHTLATADYGLPLSAVVRRGNFWGTQFHPERSGSIGARILQNFLRL